MQRVFLIEMNKTKNLKRTTRSIWFIIATNILFKHILYLYDKYKEAMFQYIDSEIEKEKKKYKYISMSLDQKKKFVTVLCNPGYAGFKGKVS